MCLPGYCRSSRAKADVEPEGDSLVWRIVLRIKQALARLPVVMPQVQEVEGQRNKQEPPKKRSAQTERRGEAHWGTPGKESKTLTRGEKPKNHCERSKKPQEKEEEEGGGGKQKPRNDGFRSCPSLFGRLAPSHESNPNIFSMGKKNRGPIKLFGTA